MSAPRRASLRRRSGAVPFPTRDRRRKKRKIRDQEPSAWSYFNQRWSRRPTKPQTRPGGPISRVWKEKLSK
ncbi:hypothetical protein U9M48_044992 [Paspalum notatum var. saurae]|uniref:Uncharacterized protein n=1 Tax=Paspalum notatum var. saurae TaxID=547442 RepID=A0AAQ3XK19_PASNO